MKILYVEDQLAENIERLLQIFEGTVLSQKQCRKLRELRDDPYGAANEDIRDIIASGVLVVETCFCEAVKRIECEWERFDLYIVDRQLATDEHAYSEEDISAIVPSFSRTDRETYLTREGDYLFMRLLSKGNMAKARMFYFMTAFTDAIHCANELRPYMDIGFFKTEQVLEKGSSEHVERLREIIGQSRLLGLRNRYMDYFSALESITPDQENMLRLARLLEACEECKMPNRSMVLGDARVLLESMVNRLCLRSNIRVDESCNRNLSELGPRNEKMGCGCGAISREAMSVAKSMYTLCSSYGSHDSNPPNEDVFTCALYALRAFILEVRK